MAAFCRGATRQHSTTAHWQHSSYSCSIQSKAANDIINERQYLQVGHMHKTAAVLKTKICCGEAHEKPPRMIAGKKLTPHVTAPGDFQTPAWIQKR